MSRVRAGRKREPRPDAVLQDEEMRRDGARTGAGSLGQPSERVPGRIAKLRRSALRPALHPARSIAGRNESDGRA